MQEKLRDFSPFLVKNIAESNAVGLTTQTHREEQQL